MSVLDSIQPGVRLLDKQRGCGRLASATERLVRRVTIWFGDLRTGGTEPAVYPVAEVQLRSEMMGSQVARTTKETEAPRQPRWPRGARK